MGKIRFWGVFGGIMVSTVILFQNCSQNLGNKGSGTTASAAQATGSCLATLQSNCLLSTQAPGGQSGTCATGETGSCSYSCTNGIWSQSSNSCEPVGCPANTLNGCTVAATPSGGSAGTCASGDSGSCSASCSSGTWTVTSNTCTLAASCAATTLSACTVGATASGGTSGACTSGDSGSCSASCSNGTWAVTANSCTAPVYTCTFNQPGNYCFAGAGAQPTFSNQASADGCASYCAGQGAYFCQYVWVDFVYECYAFSAAAYTAGESSCTGVNGFAGEESGGTCAYQ